MDRLDLEALAVRLIDQVQRCGAAAEYDVEDALSLRRLLWHEALRRGLQVHTGTVTGDPHAVWIYQPEDEAPAGQMAEVAAT